MPTPEPTAAYSCREFQAAPAAFVTPWHNAKILLAEQQADRSRDVPPEFYLGIGMFDFPMGDDDAA